MANIAELASLIADPTRSLMLLAMMNGRAMTAGELAFAGGVAPQTASGHLAKMVDCGIVAATRNGRHRYFMFASESVAHTIESMLSTAVEVSDSRRARRRPEQALRRARTCYDHYAGEVAVGLADVLLDPLQQNAAEKVGLISERGIQILQGLNLLEAGGRQPPVACKLCMDWTERRFHIGGAIGKAILRHGLQRKWTLSVPGTRAVNVTATGKAELKRYFGLDV